LVAGFIPLAGLKTEGGFAPRRHRTGATDRCSTFTTTVGVVARVHHTASHLRPPSEPTTPTSFAEACVANFRVAHFAKGCVALTPYQPNFGGRQFESDIVAFFGHHLSTSSSGSNHLSTATGIKLDAVNARTKRYG
jgi:hypothetical protein